MARGAFSTVRGCWVGATATGLVCGVAGQNTELMSRKPTPPESKPAEIYTWDVCLVADKLRWLGRVEAENEAGAVAWGAQQFGKDPKKLLVVKRSDLR